MEYFICNSVITESGILIGIFFGSRFLTFHRKDSIGYVGALIGSLLYILRCGFSSGNLTSKDFKIIEKSLVSCHFLNSYNEWTVIYHPEFNKIDKIVRHLEIKYIPEEYLYF